MEALSNLRSNKIGSESMDIRVLRKDGRIIWVRTQPTLGQRQESELKYFIISFEDISEAKWLEIEQARLYNLPNLILCVLDLQGHFKRVNSGFQTVLGYTMDELMGTDLFSLIHPEDLQRSMEAEKSGRTEDVHGFENRLRAKDGTYHWIRWTGRVVDGLNYGAGIEVTEQKVMEKELRESELRFRTFTEAMPQMAFISDEHGHISYYNKRHYEYFGLITRRS
jgi:PAS domain S-box-containing protein